jgi:hypothetical protein
MKNLKSLLVIGCVLITITAGCGSSSSPGNTDGVFADTVVAGLPYSTSAGQSGVTGPDGIFTCQVKSTVTFFVGPIVLGDATCLAVLTPLNLALAAGDTTADATNTTAVNITRFLMSISTTDASTGTLTITPEEITAAEGLSPIADWSTVTDPELTTDVDTITGEATALVDAPTATAELTDTIYSEYSGDYSGTWKDTTNGHTGSWTITIAADGSVSGLSNGEVVSGNLVSGTTYSGTAGTSTWTGTLDISTYPAVFSGTWTDAPNEGTFTGTGPMSS